VDSRTAKQKAADAGITEKVLRRAREKLSVQVIRRGKGREHVTLWLLAPQPPTDAPLNMGMSSLNGHEWPTPSELSPNWPTEEISQNPWSR
jgi:hypothetical protein